MKALLCHAYGPPESLQPGEIDPPVCGPEQVRIRVHSAAVNFPDVLMIAGQYQFRPEFPFAPGAECAGEVIETGREVRGLRPGDRVTASTGHGAFAEQVVTRATTAVKLPDGIRFPEAATLNLTYGTAAYALRVRGNLREGETLLVHGAAGGVGIASVEIGKAMGARVIATASTPEKLAFARAHGADDIINTSEGSLRDQVRDLTGGKGADVILDPVGGAVFDQSLRCINWDGRLLVVGFASGTIPSAPANLALLKSCSVIGVFWGTWIERNPAGHQENMQQVLAWLSEQRIDPHISLRLPLERAPEALEAMQARKILGKAVITIRDEP